MAIEHETTTGELARLRNADGEIDARMLSHENLTGTRATDVPRHKCEAFRRLSDTGRTLCEINGITNSSLALTTISFHIRDKCKHNYEEADP